jgi:hypothetical protein
VDCRDAHIDEKRRKSVKIRRIENPEKFAQRSRDSYAKRDKEKKKEAARTRNKERRMTDPIYLMKERIRNRTRAMFKDLGFRKTKSTFHMVGCTQQILKAHIESRFKRGMTWQNIGKWHIDHIVPLASAKTQSELIKLAHFSNLQPLWGVENFSKGCKIVTCQPELTLQLIS